MSVHYKSELISYHLSLEKAVKQPLQRCMKDLNIILHICASMWGHWALWWSEWVSRYESKTRQSSHTHTHTVCSDNSSIQCSVWSHFMPMLPLTGVPSHFTVCGSHNEKQNISNHRASCRHPTTLPVTNWAQHLYPLSTWPAHQTQMHCFPANISDNNASCWLALTLIDAQCYTMARGVCIHSRPKEGYQYKANAHKGVWKQRCPMWTLVPSKGWTYGQQGVKRVTE